MGFGCHSASTFTLQHIIVRVELLLNHPQRGFSIASRPSPLRVSYRRCSIFAAWHQRDARASLWARRGRPDPDLTYPALTSIFDIFGFVKTVEFVLSSVNFRALKSPKSMRFWAIAVLLATRGACAWHPMILECTPVRMPQKPLPSGEPAAHNSRLS